MGMKELRTEEDNYSVMRVTTTKMLSIVFSWTCRDRANDLNYLRKIIMIVTQL